MSRNREDPYLSLEQPITDQECPDQLRRANRRKAIGLVAFLIVALFSFAWAVIEARRSSKLDENFCPKDGIPPKHIVVLVDTSDPFLNDQQTALTTALQHRGQSLATGDRLSLYVLTPNDKAVVKTIFSKCKPKQRNEANWFTENADRLEQRHVLFLQALGQAIETINTSGEADRSPILEALHAIARQPLLERSPRRTLELWSDMLQKSDTLDQFKPGYDFEVLRRRGSLYLSDLTSLAGSEVVVYQLRNKYQRLQTDEHARFWREYFRAASVGELSVRPL